MASQDSNKNSSRKLLPAHGGYRKLKSFQIAQLVYDLTVRFCSLYIDKSSRTRDQMVQAARSGVQNIAEGSQASGTSKKTELKLTNVARASLEELRLDYEDFLRQRSFDLWKEDDPRRAELIKRRCKVCDDVSSFIRDIRHTVSPNSNQLSPHGASIKSISSIPSTHEEVYSGIAANAILVLIGVANTLLDRQIKSQAEAFLKDGGFTEKLYAERKKQHSGA